MKDVNIAAEETENKNNYKDSFKFAVYQGNHPEVVREALIRRKNFTEVHTV